ncbi:MAG TPA: hypothetical protein VHN99_01390 [Deinococcales bacterium]|nr:hypothetical protein [Deinococcales bacterium]
MHELLLLTKSGREIKVGEAHNPEQLQQMTESAKNVLGSLKNAETQGGLITIERDGNTYFLVPSEIEGACIYRVDDEAQ